MREVNLSWNAKTIERSDFAQITAISNSYEVVAHLGITPSGARQLVKISLKAGYGISNINEIDYLEVEGQLNSHPLPKEGGEGIIIVWNRHPLSVAAINFDSLHVIPPYTIGKEGVQITIRGLPESVSGFLKTTRLLFPPDSVKVVEIEAGEHELFSILSPKQIETTILAYQAGYYQNPRGISMRELSELTKIPRSTLQEHLAKSEISVMNWVAKTYLSH
jgi:hypothetical protein